MRIRAGRSLGWLLVVATVLPASGANADLVSGQPAQDLFKQAVTQSAYTEIMFSKYPAGTQLTTQIAGLTFRTIRDFNGTPLSGVPVIVETSLPSHAGQIVGTPCSGCSDDGRYAYDITFTTPQRAAGIQRIWNQYSVTRFFAADGHELGEFTGSAYVGWFGLAGDTSTYVKRIEFDGNLYLGTRQVGYSNDLIYGQGAIPEPATASLLALGLAGLAARTRRRI